METKEFRVTGMTCGGCENTLQRAVGYVEGVAEAKADHQAGLLTVTFDPAKTRDDDIKEAVEFAGFELVG